MFISIKEYRILLTVPKIQKKYLVQFWLLVIGITAYYYHNTITEFPMYMHSWTQSDHYALTIGFTKNGLNLFHPQTYYLNPQIKPVIKQTQYLGITAADLPVYDYLAAILMKLFNTRAVAVCRIITLLFALTGLFCLYKFTFLLTQNNLPSLFLTVFVFTCPLYNYFQAGFIPTIPSLALTFCAFYFYYLFLRNNSYKQLLIAIFCLSIASLARMTFLIYLTALLVHQLLIMFRNKKITKQILTYFFAAFAMIIAYRIYNVYLQKMYGAAFLGSLRPINFKWFADTFMEAYNNWVLHYFTKWHYILMLLLIVIFIYQIIFRKISLSQNQKLLFELSLIMFFGCTAFYLLMQTQFNHDYYFLDSFFALTLLMLILFLSIINWKNKMVLILWAIIFSSFSIFAFFDCNTTLNARCGDKTNDMSYQMQLTFRNANDFLNKIGIDNSKNILILNSYSSNIPFILMDRSGFCVIHWERDQILEALTLPFDYIIILNKSTNNVFGSVPELKTLLNPVANSGRFTVYKALWKK